MPESVLEIFGGLDRTGAPDNAGLLNERALDWASGAFTQLARHAAMGIWVVDIATGEIRWSRQAYAIHGLSPDQKIDREAAIAVYAAEDRDRISAAYDRSVVTGNLQFEATIRPPNGPERGVKCFGERVSKGYRGAVMMGYIQDITDAYESNRKLVHAAFHDGLTGLLNRRGFDDRLAAMLTGPRKRSERALTCSCSIWIASKKSTISMVICSETDVCSMLQPFFVPNFQQTGR